MKNIRLISFEVYQENDNYFAKAVYRFEDEKGIWEETYPKIRLPINQYSIPAVNHTETANYRGHIIDATIDSTIDLGFGELPLEETDKCVLAERRLVKEKVHDMTIAEIEKKLGYKIKIVGEKGETNNAET